MVYMKSTAIALIAAGSIAPALANYYNDDFLERYAYVSRPFSSLTHVVIPIAVKVLMSSQRCLRVNMVMICMQFFSL